MRVRKQLRDKVRPRGPENLGEVGATNSVVRTFIEWEDQMGVELSVGGLERGVKEKTQLNRQTQPKD